jgi:acyl-CoA thioester hydrolase
MTNPENKPLFVEQQIRVKTYDIDFIGHVNNAVYVRWLEDLRLHLLDTYYPLEEMTADNIAPIIVNTNVHYRQGIVLDDKHVTAQMWVKEFARATFLLEAQFFVGAELKCTADQRGTFIDSQKMRPVRVPERFRALYDEPRQDR